MKAGQRQLHHAWHMKTNCSIKYSEEDYQSHNNNTSEINDKVVWHATRILDEGLAKLIHKDSSRSANRLNT